jgi:hypothetical protein
MRKESLSSCSARKTFSRNQVTTSQKPTSRYQRFTSLTETVLAAAIQIKRRSPRRSGASYPPMATRKKPPVMTECEVKVRGRWLPCTLYEALTERGEAMRCKHCHGPVQALKESSTGARAHIEHLQSHPGCRFPVSKFCGVKSKHPLALE